MTQTKALQIDEQRALAPSVSVIGEDPVSIKVEDLNLFYDGVQALKDIKLDIAKKQVTAFIGPSGCGKSTLLRCFNRMNDLIDGCNTQGRILMNGQDILAKDIDVAELRRQVGMVFQKPNPFPKSIYEKRRLWPSYPGSEQTPGSWMKPLSGRSKHRLCGARSRTG